MQQHLMQIQPMMAAYYPTNVTTDHIQQYLDENKSLILKIVESQNLGKLSECAENQARLQRNLMYLAAIADSQPQPPSMHSQYAPSGILQPSAAHYMQQHQQAAAAAAQQMSPQSLMSSRSSMLYGASQTYPSLQQQSMHGGGGMGSGQTSGLMLQGDPHLGSGVGLGVGGFPEFIRGGGSSSNNANEHVLQGGNMRGLGKQDLGSGVSGEGRHDGGGETLFLKGAEEGN